MHIHYRSLYWRIGVGFIVCIATVLAIQGSVLLWLLSREEPNRQAFTQEVSQTLEAGLEADARLDVQRFVDERYGTAGQSFYVVLRDGRAFYFGDKRPTERAIAGVRDEFQHGDRNDIPHFWQLAPYWAAPIMVNGTLGGTVSIVAQDAGSELWPPMALLGVTLLVVGTVLASRFIFGPAHQRLRALEATARRLGAGDARARAEEEGGDEVASLARTFNIMAGDLSARAAELIESDRTRRLLLADISHELMTPLTAIRGYQEKLASDLAINSSTQRRSYVAIIGEEAQRVERIVRDLLDLARFEGGGNVLDLQDVSLEGLFGRVAARQQADATARRVRLSTIIEPGAEIVRGDPFRLEQALQNLAANSLRHTPDGGLLELHAHADGTNIVIAVRDNGAGIMPEHLPFIFDRFYKADASRAAGVNGSGLGLSIVKAIVERHGGVITAASRPNIETVFTITLPASAEVTSLPRSA